MRVFMLGERVCHPDFGEGTVTFIGKDYVGIEFDGKRDALVRKDDFEVSSRDSQEVASHRQGPPLSWPDSTFLTDPPEANHFLGSHWDPFYETSDAVLVRLPEILAEAQMHRGHDATSGLGEPATWQKGVHLVWPAQEQGIAITCRIQEEAKTLEMVAMYPFRLAGALHRIRLTRVMVWESGLEAQIEASLGEAEITFFDTLFLVHRCRYEAGKEYDFVLSGIAYSAEPASQMEFPYSPNPDQLAWERMLAERRGDAPPKVPDKIVVAGMAMFVPVEGWDRDDYSFRVPVKSVKEIRDMLGQEGWLVRGTVMRLSEYRTEDVDLDILITRKAWKGSAPPNVGQDIEGALWLQGRLGE